MHILVTGGAGFIGSHLVDALLARGDAVTVVDDFSSGDKTNLPSHGNLEIIEFTLGKELPLQLRANVFGAVIHLAGLPSVAASWERALEAHERNLTATLALIDACSRLAIPRFIFASSAAVYGVPSVLPIPENAVCAPLSPYGLQKLESEKYMQLFAKQRGLCGIALRLFNVYGPRQRPDSAYSGVISIFASAMRKRQPIVLYGDGKQTRDFVAVSDVVDAFCAAVNVPLAAGEFRAFNIGTGQRTSLSDLIDVLHQCIGGEYPKIQRKGFRAGDIGHSEPNIRAAVAALGFQPRVNLPEGLEILLKSI